jgi:hypothetical protein
VTKIIKRDRQTSSADLVAAIEILNPLLEEQEEDEAVAHLKKATATLKTAAIGSDGYKAAIEDVLDAFEGDFELSAYTHSRKDSKEWGVAEQLTVASCRVLNLARRMKA